MSPRKPKAAGTQATYHHGDLRNALIVAAAELIEESGCDDFAIIDAARRAGVSSAAPYRHFRDKEDLLWAVSDLGFYALISTLRETADSLEPGTLDCIVALGQTYMGFVIAHPAFFDLMWGERSTAEEKDPGDAHYQLRASGFTLLVEQVSLWLQSEQLHNVSPEELALKLWSLGIGFSHLAINHHLERFVDDVDTFELAANSTRSLLQGVLGSNAR